jgi:hypothetical protein
MYTIVSDRYGSGDYDKFATIIRQVHDLGYDDPVVGMRRCECGECIWVIETLDSEIVAVETDHTDHQAW